MLCHCDGPPHVHDPSWCIRPKFEMPSIAEQERFGLYGVGGPPAMLVIDANPDDD